MKRPWWDSWVIAIVIALAATAMILAFVLTAWWHACKLKAGF